MTREEKYASIFQNETVYRPLQEDGSVLLEVSLGCSWHKCAFCAGHPDSAGDLPGGAPIYPQRQRDQHVRPD